MEKLLQKTKFIEYQKTNSYKLLFTIIFLFLSIFIYLLTIFFTGTQFTVNVIEYGTLLRTTSAAITGFGLSIAGCGMQGITRNDLSGPSTLGILPAATFGIIISQILKLEHIYFVFIFSFIFTFLVLIINFINIKITTGKHHYKPILIGLILGAILISLSFILKSVFPYVSERLHIWIGSESNSYTWKKFFYATPIIFIGILIILSSINKINIIDKNISIAISLGINIKKTYWTVGIGSVLIAVSSVILFGSISIIGVVIPHICRMILKTRDYKWLILSSGFLSASVVMFSTLMNAMFSLGINLFIVFIFVPIFLLSIFIQKKK